MNWWQKLSKNPIARLGALILIFFYGVAVCADFVAPYDPYLAQANGSLLPPTQIHGQLPNQGKVGFLVYPTAQGKTDPNTGDRFLVIDTLKPSNINLFVKGFSYNFLALTIPLPPPINEIKIFPGIKTNWHLFGTSGEGKLNLLGTDEQGRDQFSRLVYGSRISLSIGLVGIMISFPLGLIIGGISGYFGGWLDTFLMRLVEVLMTIPGIYLLVSLAAVLPPTLSGSQRFLLIVAITSLISWSGLARVIRGQVLSIKEREFIQAARSMGASPLRIIIRHILPQTATYVIISATLAVPSFIISESVLSFIGLGIKPPDPSWGNMLSIATNASVLVLQPWLVWSPALLIITTVLAFNLLGDGLRDALDPRNLQGD